RPEGHRAQLEQPDPWSGLVRTLRDACHGGGSGMAGHDPLHRRGHLPGGHRSGLHGHLVATVLQPGPQRPCPSGPGAAGSSSPDSSCSSSTRPIAPAGRKLVINWRAASWIPPWLIGLGIISYLGQYPMSKPSSGWPFGIALLAKQDIPFWVDLGVVA